MKKAVLLIAFNRKRYLEQVFAQVAKARPPRLYLASDGARKDRPGEKEKVLGIRKWMIENVTWPCEVKTRFLDVNSGGCGTGVSQAVSWFFEKEKDGIVLEDDCVPSETFFRYAEECLDRYANDKRIWHISGFAPIHAHGIKESYYFSNLMFGWGWAGWADRWRNFNSCKWCYPDTVFRELSQSHTVRSYWRHIMKSGSEGKIDTWDYQWMFTILSNGGLCIIPCVNLVSNIGEHGTHYDGGKSAGRCINREKQELGTVMHPGRVMINQAQTDRIMNEFSCPFPARFSFLMGRILSRLISENAFEKLRKMYGRLLLL